MWALSLLTCGRFVYKFKYKHKHRRSKFLLGDFSNYNLKDANTVMIFAVPRTMPVLGRKIQSECSRGTNIMAYRFEMPLALKTDDETFDKNNTTNPSRIEERGESIESSHRHTSSVTLSDADADNEKDDDEDLRLRATCTYDREEMRIYRMGE